MITDQALVNSISAQILDGHKHLVTKIHAEEQKTTDTNSTCKDILAHIDLLQEKYQNTQLNMDESVKLLELKNDAEFKYTKSKSELEEVMLERDCLKGQFDQLQIEFTKLEASKSVFESEIKKLESIVRSAESNMKQSEEKVQKCKTTCDSKLRSQLEIHKLIKEERDKLRVDLKSQVSHLFFFDSEHPSNINDRILGQITLHKRLKR